MASVWKRLQRVNKRAAKFQYTASYHRVDLETSPKWKPNKLSIVWTRRSRRVVTEPVEWEPSLKDPLKGSVLFAVPENHTVAVTLFKDSRTNELEDKDWTFVLEDVSVTGKRRRLAVCALNMRKHASLEPTQRPLLLTLDPTTHKIVSASIQLTLHCVLLREGQATDEDMQSLASLLSVNNNSDIAVLEDLDEDDYTLSDQSTKQMSDLRQQMEEMTQSLTSSDIAATPNSVQSLNFDNSRTPTAPITPEINTPATPVPTEITPTTETDQKTTETSNASKTKHDFLSNLTKMAMKTEQPKFTSTPNKITTPNNTEIKPELKGVVFKPKTIAKRNLKPLDLKTNLNSIGLDKNDNEEEDCDKTPTGDVDKLFPVKSDRDKTPVQDLLEWCQSATREYRSCRVTNLTTSFRSGLAFCAIIHNYRPDLIDFSGLQPDEAEKNLRVALEASATLGISQVLSAADVCSRPTPDRLAIMTYLFQLRAHFTGNELQVEQLGNDETESSYMVGRHDTDGSLPQELFSREVSTRRSKTMADRPRPGSQESQESRKSQERCTPDKITPPPMKDVRDLFLHQSKSILGKMLSPSRDYKEKATAKWFDDPLKNNEPMPVRPEKLMTRKELTDPFGSDDEEEQPEPAQARTANHQLNNGNVDNDKSEETQPTLEPTTMDPLTLNSQHSDQQIENNRTLANSAESRLQAKPVSPELPKPTPQLLSRHDELKERARQLLEATRREAREKDRLRRQNSKEKEEANKEVANGLRNGETSPKKPMTDEERQAMLRERARKLIADARAGILSPTSPSRPRAGAVEIISKQSVMEEFAAAGGMEQLDMMLSRSDSIPSSPGSRKSSASPDRYDEQNSEESRSVKSAGSRRSPLQSFSALVDRLTPDRDKRDPNESNESGSYIASEVEALEREQAAIDVRAAALEKRLRAVMESADNTEEEDRLMSQWFNLVNKKNALLRRQMQLNILEQEEDLSRRCELLARELRLSLGVDEWRKTPGQKRRERLLLQELISAVNERDRLVQEMDEQEKAIADDDEIERNLTNVEIQRKNNCILQ